LAASHPARRTWRPMSVGRNDPQWAFRYRLGTKAPAMLLTEVT
jgi:hypothetical protein